EPCGHVSYDSAGHVVDSISYNPSSALCRLCHINDKKQNDVEYSIKYGYMNGEYLRHYINGAVLEKSSFKDGKRDGACVEYFPDGKVSLKGDYKNGKKIGKWEYFNEGGLMWREETFKKNGKEGLVRVFAGEELRIIKYMDSATVYLGEAGRI